MSKEFNPYSLYKNIVPRFKIPGLYKHDNLNNKTQSQWLAFYDNNGGLYLVDTLVDIYHINLLCNFKDTDNNRVFKPLGNTQIDIFIANHNNEIHEKYDSTWYINESNNSYYYGGSVKVNNDWDNYFEEVCDLREYKSTNTPYNYDTSDIIEYVQLWLHGYPNGVTLVKKDAKESDDAKLEYLINQFNNYIKPPKSPRNFYINKMKKLNPTNKKLIKKVNNCEKMNEKLKELAQEWDDFYKSIN